MTILYILLFIVCLSTLIMVHEAGHLITAKIFKVYCFEYAIGFGPKLFSSKRKGGETAFSLRAIPFGGFVSMYGESETLPEGHEPIDESRSLNSIKKWKKCIILVAGVTMNFLLALTIFFVYEIGFPAHVARVNHITVKKNSLVYDAGLRNKDFVYTAQLENGDNLYFFYDNEAVIIYQDSTEKNVYLGYNYVNITLKDQSLYSFARAFDRQEFGALTTPATPISYDDAINGEFSGDEVVYNSITGFLRNYSIKKSGSTYKVGIVITENYLDKEDKAIYAQVTLTKEEANYFKNVPLGEYVTMVGDFSTVTKKSDKYNLLTVSGSDNLLTHYADVAAGNALAKKSGSSKPSKIDVNFYKLNKETNNDRGETIPVNNIEISSNGKLPKNIGVSMQLDSYYQNFGDAVKYTFKDFGKSATLIVRGLGQLFTGKGWQNVGGIIAIGVSTTQVLEQNGFGLFLFYWALISVNLGIVNLLPFPGLDGWQLLVTIVEGATRKTIPNKVKNIVSAIGIGLLFVLMILIIIKDLFAVI